MCALAVLGVGATVVYRASKASTASPAATTAAPVETTTTTLKPLRTITVSTTGDFLLHMPVQQRALSNGGGKSYDFSPMLAEIAPSLSAVDIAYCHMETPLTSSDHNLTGYPIFNTAHEIADAAKAAGYDSCSTASNHSLDQGESGITQTLNELDRVGLGHVGTARSALEAFVPDLQTVKGVKVAHLDYTYGTNGIPVPAGKPWLLNLINIDQAIAAAAEAKAAGANIVIVEMHWGEEYSALPSATQRAQAAALLASPSIDLVIGQHTHVVQAAEKIGKKYVIYGTGNILSNQGAPATPVPTNDGVIVKIAFTEQRDGSWLQSVTYVPTFVDRSTYVIHFANAFTNNASYQRTVTAMNGLGPGTFDGTPGN
ncbi:MAG: CapA family protein [Actinobacteria bacterium]|nr:CapA family protein [Actinomycetota bacterium]